MFNNLHIKSFLGAAIGAMLEYYDMILFIIFLPIIAPVFFGAGQAGITKGYWIFFITALARPLGALCFGYIGDFLGRPKALLSSMYGIALATFIIGITPSYQHIGAWALVIVIAAKAVQTFCFGGEFNGAGIYVVEHAKPGKENSTGGYLSALAISGSLFASLFGIVITLGFMPVWSWRIAFIIGGIAGLLGIQFRKKMLESPHFVPADEKRQTIWQLLKQYPMELLAGFFVSGMGTVAYTTAVVFLNPLLLAKGLITTNELMMLQTSLIVFSIVTLLVVAPVADRFGAQTVMKFASCLFLASLPWLKLISADNALQIISLGFWLILLTELFFTPVNAFFKNLFPMQFRYRGASFSSCLGMSILGGMTPMVENYFYHRTGQLYSGLLWIVLVAGLTLISLITLSKRNSQVLASEI